MCHLPNDDALRVLLRLNEVPQTDRTDNWLRRLSQSVVVVSQINSVLLSDDLHHRRCVTLDINVTEICSAKRDANYSYNKNQGYMPMVGHIAETRQIVASDFRAGNVATAKDNMAFIEQCEQALPKVILVGYLRNDAAGDQTRIFEYCLEQKISFAIRANFH